MTFGEWIREKRGLRKAVDCAARAWPGKSGAKQMWSDLENDRTRRKEGLPTRPNIETLEAIAHGLEIPVEDVIQAARRYITDEATNLPDTMVINSDGTAVAANDGQSNRQPTPQEVEGAMAILQRWLDSAKQAAEKQAQIRGSSMQEIDSEQPNTEKTE